MRRVVFLVLVLTTSGCGSCLDDERVPAADAPAPEIVTTVVDGGRRRIHVGRGNDFTHALELRDGGAAGR